MSLSEDPYGWRNYVKYSAAVFSSVVILIGFVWGGVRLDECCIEFSPWGKISGILTGLSLGGFTMIKQIKNKK